MANVAWHVLLRKCLHCDDNKAKVAAKFAHAINNMLSMANVARCMVLNMDGDLRLYICMLLEHVFLFTSTQLCTLVLDYPAIAMPKHLTLPQHRPVSSDHSALCISGHGESTHQPEDQI
jgi:hypothetical protein